MASLLLAGCAPARSELAAGVTRIPVGLQPSEYAELQGPTGELTFWVEEAHLDPALFPAGVSCARGAGRWLLQLHRVDGDFEAHLLFVEAVEREGALVPVAAGLLLWTCVGRQSIQNLAGTLVLDSSVQGRLRVRAELGGDLGGTAHAFVGDFLIRLGEGCEDLEADLAMFGLR